MTKQERVAMGHRLRQQRTLLGLTREEFAELADISAGYYGQIEVGTSQMSIDTLIKLSKTSQLSMEYILLGEEIQPDADLTAIEALLARCTPREVRLAEKVLRLFLLRGDIAGLRRPDRSAPAGLKNRIHFLIRRPPSTKIGR